jgi:hypothetical protein
VSLDQRELRPGLRRWTTEHPAWSPDEAWPQLVGSVAAELDDGLVVVDPQVPTDPDEAARLWSTLAADVDRTGLPVVVLLTCEWHGRSSAAVAERFGAPVWHPGSETPLPAGVAPIRVEGADWEESLLVLPRYAAVVAGDVILGAPAGGVRLPADWYGEEFVAGTLRPLVREHLLGRGLELVLVSHGEPVLGGGDAALRAEVA